MAIGGGVALYIYRNDITRNKWWMWALVIIGILLAIGGLIAVFAAPTVSRVANVVYPTSRAEYDTIPAPQVRVTTTTPQVATIPRSADVVSIPRGFFD